ncbi:MAG TPA: hypothetical protein PK228_16425 [Saprospiraceae bacterium]|nr:hypothetical protein [Saprospiraceae bacterium]
MKHKSLLRVAVLGLAVTAFLFSGCLRDDCESTRTYVRFDPVYKLPAEVRVGMSVQSPRALHDPGKIYVFGQYLFINERNEGIHVIDNADPANPKPLAFWSIPGNGDMAIRGHYLYANQYVDLLTIDISNFQNPQIVCRSESAFQPYGFDPQQGYLIDYVQSEVTETIDCNDTRWGQFWFQTNDVLFLSQSAVKDAQSSGNNSSPLAAVGIGGSYARFTIVDQYLYTIDNALLRSWSVSSTCPARLDSTWVGWNIETIFPWKDKLFIGSQTGVFIFNNSNPQRPVMEAQFSHATGCDPVVCDEKYAYVTIHDGTTCNGTFNQLDVIGIENLPATELDKVYQMKRPFGLAVTNDYLYLCDDGLKIFDKTNPLDLKEKSHTTGFDAYDIIALGAGQLLLIGADGFYQFDASDPENPRQISLIPVTR